MCRVECDGSEECGCACRCHERCRFPMPVVKEPCWRLTGHGGNGRRGDGHRAQSIVIEERSRWRERNHRVGEPAPDTEVRLT